MADDRSTRGDTSSDTGSPFFSTGERPRRRTPKEELNQERGFLARAFNRVFRAFIARDQNIAVNGADIGAIRNFTDPTFVANGDSRWLDDFPQPGLFGGRLSAAATAAPVSDVTGTTLFVQPFRSNLVHLFDPAIPTRWVPYAFGPALSIGVGSLVIDTNYDVFLYWTGSAVAMELWPWASDTARDAAHDLVRQDGALVDTADPTRLYIGTIRTYDTAGVIFRDTKKDRGIWNMFNRLDRVSEDIVTGAGTLVLGSSAGTYNAFGSINGAFDQTTFVLGLLEEDALPFGCMTTVIGAGAGLLEIGAKIDAGAGPFTPEVTGPINSQHIIAGAANQSLSHRDMAHIPFGFHTIEGVWATNAAFTFDFGAGRTYFWFGFRG